MKEYVMQSPVGPLRLCQEGEAIVGLYFGGQVTGAEPPTALLGEVREQLNQYFAGARKRFELPLQFGGTAFQHGVWEALLDIPYGETRTYGQIAAAIGRPKAVRAVGHAIGSNPISILVPCHRVIGKDGSLTGFGGGLAIKELLLKGEGIPFKASGT